MGKNENHGSLNRREFIKLLAAGTVGGQAFFSSPRNIAKKYVKTDDLSLLQGQLPMTYRKLGRVNFKSSRLVFGGGAALVGGKAVRLLDRALEAGINHFDVGSNIVYKGAERSLAPFLKKKNRDKVWVTSKAPVSVRVKPEDLVTVAQAKTAAKSWMRLMDTSLKNLEIDYIDAYYLMAVDNPSLARSEEMYNAFLTAKKTGKVGYFGLSTHKNAQKVLEAAIDTDWYDVALIGITPAGWYDWDTHDLVPGTPTLVELEGLLERARAAGIGLIGMKTVRHLAPKMALGKGNLTAFDRIYDERFLSLPLNPFQRAYAYVLEHGIDVVNADMQNFKHLEENIVATATSPA